MRTIGELELIAHARAAAADDRKPPRGAVRSGNHSRSARSLPHVELPARIDELNPGCPTVLFCSGPQCAATPSAVNTLLDQGYPATALLYYRGGLHDWITLGLSTVGGEQQHSQ